MLKLMKYELPENRIFQTGSVSDNSSCGNCIFNRCILEKRIIFWQWELFFLVMCTIFGVIYIGIESVNVLHRDLNTKQSYMLFLTPKSSYQILGAKILENGISIIMAGAFLQRWQPLM